MQSQVETPPQEQGTHLNFHMKSFLFLGIVKNMSSQKKESKRWVVIVQLDDEKLSDWVDWSEGYSKKRRKVNFQNDLMVDLLLYNPFDFIYI